MKKITLLLLIAGAINITCTLAQSTNQKYKISKKINLPGDGGWDYLTVDEPTQRLYISHGTETHVMDIKTGNLLHTFTDTKGVHGIAIANDINKGFISNGKDTSVTIFNLQTSEVITKTKITGVKPDAILYDEFSNKVFVFNGKTNNATVIDANTNSVIETIKLEGKPEFSATDGKGKVYVNIEDKNSIAVINASSLKVDHNWSITPGEEPTGLAFDVKNHRLFSVCGNKKMMVIDSESGKIISSVAIGDGCDGVAFDVEKKCIFAANGEGNATVIQQETENKYKVTETIKTQAGARTITLSKTSHQIFIPVAELGDMPLATKENPKPKPAIKPNSFIILVIE